MTDPDKTITHRDGRQNDSEESAAMKKRAAAMAAALERLAEAGGPEGFGDAAEWERETREDSSLPGRES